MTRTFWMSFVDPDRPDGQKFLGACVVDVTEAEAHAACAELTLMRALDPDAEWYGAATRKAWESKCNPGGEIMILDLTGAPELAYYERGVLMDRPTLEAIGDRIDADEAVASDT